MKHKNDTNWTLKHSLKREIITACIYNYQPP